jgi:hypothetical protein
MSKHALIVLLVSAAMAATSGCCGPMFCPSTGLFAICDPTYCCDDACGAQGGCAECEAGPACGPCGGAPVDANCEPCCEACGDACSGSCCDACSGSCCDTTCGPNWFLWGPFYWLFGVGGWGCSNSGCGEFYWSDFHSEPPDCCDPCDRCGNWTGGCYDGGCAQAGSPGCSSGQCAVRPPQGRYAAKRRAASGRVAQRGASTRNRPVPAWATRGLEGPVITDPSSPYAPELVSVTDHAAGPTLAQTTPAEEAAERPVVRQASAKQVANRQPARR